MNGGTVRVAGVSLAPTPFPSKTITMVVPYAAGGSSDTRARQIAAKRQAMTVLVKSTFPQMGAVFDAPVQMQRQTDLLRAAAGKTGDADLETLFGLAASAWPEGQAPVQTLKFENGRLSFAANGWSDAQLTQFRSQLAAADWSVTQDGSTLTVTRAATAAKST